MHFIRVVESSYGWPPTLVRRIKPNNIKAI